jgi:hypothetical protein
VNRLALFALLSLSLASLQATAQTTIGHVGALPPGPANLSAIQEALPNAQVSSIQSMPGNSGMIAPGQAAPGLIAPGMPAPQGPMDASGGPADLNADKQFPLTAEERAAQRRAFWDAGSASQYARQKGLQIGRGDQLYVSIAGSALASDRMVLLRWKQWLPQFGVDPAKVEDESRRLSRAQFDAWASRFVWLSCNGPQADDRPVGCALLDAPASTIQP